MGKPFLLLALLLAAATAYKSCPRAIPEKASFTGRWKSDFTFDQGSAHVRTQKTISVVSAKGKFRIHEKEFNTDIWDPARETEMMYDGESFHQRHKLLSGHRLDQSKGVAPHFDQGSVNIQSLSPQKAAGMRFWTHRMSRKYNVIPVEVGPAESVAGRRTILFQAQLGDEYSRKVTVRKWIDAETFVVLKSSESYSDKYFTGQSETLECVEIKYGAVDPSVFDKL